MPNDDVKTGSQSNASEPSAAEKALQAKLSELNSVISDLRDKSKVSADLMEDPDVLQVLESKKRGKKVEISSRDPEPEPDPIEELLRMGEDDSESNKKLKDFDNVELVKHLGSKFDAMVKASIEKMIAPIKQESEALKQSIASQRQAERQQALVSDVAKVAESHPDFESYQDDMIKLHERALKGELTVEEFYKLAKVSKIGLPSEQGESEYPTSILGLSKQPKPENVRHGPRGFEEAIRDAMSKRRY